MAIKTDSDSTADVLAELAWDPSVTTADMDVAVSGVYVTLSGTAATHRARDAAVDAASRVSGVRGVASEIVVDPALLGDRSAAAIQGDVRSAPTVDTLVPLDRVGIAVYDDLATLTGNYVRCTCAVARSRTGPHARSPRGRRTCPWCSAFWRNLPGCRRFTGPHMAAGCPSVRVWEQ